MTTHKKPTTPDCECGCGARTKGGRFLPGHDAKLKKALVEAAMGGSKRAANKLEKLGWKKFLAAKKTTAGKRGASTTDKRHEPAPQKKPGPTAAEKAKAFLPQLQPPLDEKSARILGFGDDENSDEEAK